MRCAAAPLVRSGPASDGLPGEERLHHLEEDHEREVGDRQGGEEAERCAPPASNAGPARLRHDEIRDPRPQPRDGDDEGDTGQGPQVPAGKPGPIAQGHVVGEEQPAQHDGDGDAAEDGAEYGRGRVAELAPANLQPGSLPGWAGCSSPTTWPWAMGPG